MIFVTIGMHTTGFERLVKKMDEVAGKINEEVIIQTGTTKYAPKNAKRFKFASYQKIQELNRDARLVVAHAGTGSVITALKQNTPIVVVPRLKEYNEVIDTQQLELAEMIKNRKGITVVYNMDELEKTVTSDHTENVIVTKSERNLEKAIKTIIEYSQ